MARLEFLIVHINKTNEATKSRNGKTISELISQRDVLNEKLSIFRSFVDAGSNLVNRISHTEIRTLSTFKVVDMQKQIDKISQEIRTIDTSIQELNWTTELI